MKNKVQKDEQMKRIHQQSFLLNSKEMRAIDRYCKKYKISNRSRFIRETIISAILKKFDEDHPTLFDLDEKPNLFSSSGT
jgi:metal-responsive CopG/Arc/MetJ family transcriptional regulator